MSYLDLIDPTWVPDNPFTPGVTADGDTVHGFTQTERRRAAFLKYRLAGIDCPESNSADPRERAAAAAATAFTREWLATHHHRAGDLHVRNEGPDKYGDRDLGTIYAVDLPTSDINRCLNSALVAAGHASVWPTRWHEAFPPPPQPADDLEHLAAQAPGYTRLDHP